MASNKVLNVLYWVMRAVSYRRTAVAIKMASLFGTFFDCCFVCCCPGSCWGNIEQVVAQWQHPVASRVALDMLHREILSVLPGCTAVVIEMANNGGHSFIIIDFVINHNHS